MIRWRFSWVLRSSLPAGHEDELAWTIDDLGGAPIANVGIEVTAQDEISGKFTLILWIGTAFRTRASGARKDPVRCGCEPG